MSMIQVTNLTFAYDGTYDDIFKNVSFRVDTNWKLGLIGRNGRGKTTFLNLLMGKYSYSGSIQTDTVFEYFPYEVADKSAVTMDVMQSVAPECEEWEIMKELSLLDMEIDLLYQPFETLSNGEQTRVLLAALFLRSNRFLLIDEPTNHLDHRARQAVAAYLRR
ncbi:MAG: ABC-F family ATP-binding cassette domain-containing protein, partial [Oscillospiraceae bacterium]|nr:ABC-F family ATP-binding cassette domain-containing protein [Oscillospiraceae bacterium]